jgi:hypothetical protein
MKASVRHSLVQQATLASTVVVEKAASAQPAQLEVIEAVFPSADQNITKTAALARVLATAEMVEEPA